MTITATSRHFDQVQTAPLEAPEPILCQYCLRTANNGIKCRGMCVADVE